MNKEELLQDLYDSNERDIGISKETLEYFTKLQKENEELKNADLTSIYMKGFYDSESKWKDKIRDKRKELEDFKNKFILCNSRDYFQIERTIKVLEDLLKEN